MKTDKKLFILGAGVSGLSTGILLLKKGYKVTIWAKDTKFMPEVLYFL